MPMNLDSVGSTSDAVERSWNSTDCLLYALGVGAGSLDATTEELEFTTENSAGIDQRVLPTFASILGAGNRSAPRTGAKSPGGPSPVGSGARQVAFEFGTFDPAMLVHGEQAIELHGLIPPEGTVRTTTTVSGVYDKGSGALVVLSARSVDATDGTLRFATSTSLFVRGEGGFGGPRGPEGALGPVPDREADEVVRYSTRPDQALLYRLSGDRNPLHSDPVFAARAGFERPILHGLCTYGFTGRALLHALCGSDPGRFGAMSGRFTRPVMPGDTLEVHIWLEDGGARYRTTSNGAGSAANLAIDAGAFRFA
jgi:acyl dehydratase